MSEGSRREFLKKLARTAVYTAPVIHTLTAPVELVGQGVTPTHKPPMAPAYDQSSPTSPRRQQPASEAPWDRPPPGGKWP